MPALMVSVSFKRRTGISATVLTRRPLFSGCSSCACEAERVHNIDAADWTIEGIREQSTSNFCRASYTCMAVRVVDALEVNKVDQGDCEGFGAHEPHLVARGRP